MTVAVRTCSRLTFLVLTLSLATWAPPLRAIDFAFIYDDSDGEGFWDPVSGAERRQAMEAAGDVWGRLIRPSYVGETITVRVKFDDYPTDSNTLASAKPHHFYSEFDTSSPDYLSDTNYPKALANHLALTDVAPARHEIDVSVNRAVNFYYGTGGMPGTGQHDFVTVAIHELGHGLGLVSSFRENGEFGLLGNGTFLPDPLCIGCLPTPYDRFISTGLAGFPLLSLSDDDREAGVTSNNLFWNGPDGALGNGGVAPQLYAPSPYDEGSSISHLDPSTPGNPVMVPKLGAGAVTRTLTRVERGMLRDMGWNISVNSQDVVWQGIAGNAASTPGNWSPDLPLPGDNLVFGSLGDSNDIDFDLTLYSVGSLTLAPEAPGYTLRFRPWTDTDLVGTGVVNSSSEVQTIVLEVQESLFGEGVSLGGARMAFKNTASASDAHYVLQAGVTTIGGTSPNFFFIRPSSARVTFSDNANAAQATITVQGGGGNGGPNALLIFDDNASANSAKIVNQPGRTGPTLPMGQTQTGFGGQTRFQGNATGSVASIRNEGIADSADMQLGTGGWTTFADNSSAGNAEIINLDSPQRVFGGGGATEFTDSATAEIARFINHGASGTNGGGRTVFFHQSTAGTARFQNLNQHNMVSSGDGRGKTQFRDLSTAGAERFPTTRRSARALLSNEGGLTQFFDEATASDARIEIGSSPGGVPGITEFHGSSSASLATIELVGASQLLFFDDSTAAKAEITGDSLGFSSRSIQFRDRATAAEAEFDLDDRPSASTQIEFWDESSAGHATFNLGRSSHVAFYNNANAAEGSFTLPTLATLTVNDTATLGDAQIHVLGADLPSSGPGSVTVGGQVTLRRNQSAARPTAGNATIIVEGGRVPSARGGHLRLEQGSNGGQATFILNGGVPGAFGGTLLFGPQSQGSETRVVANEGSQVTIQSTNFAPALSTAIGSIEGAGQFEIAALSELVTGGLNADTTVVGTIGGPGRLTKIGSGTLTLAGNNTYFGRTTVNEGTLSVTGSLSPFSDVVVNSGGTLAGTGTIGGKVTVNPGGTFTPGTSPGTITVGELELMADSLLEFEIGTTSDSIVVTGGVTLAGILQISLLDGFIPTLGQSFALFDGIDGPITGSFSSIVAPTTNGLTFSLAFNGGLPVLHVVNTVPEPSTTLLLLTASAFFLLSLLRKQGMPAEVRRATLTIADTQSAVLTIPAVLSRLGSRNADLALHKPPDRQRGQNACPARTPDAQGWGGIQFDTALVRWRPPGPSSPATPGSRRRWSSG